MSIEKFKTGSSESFDSKSSSGVLEFQKLGPKRVSKFESLKFKLMRSSKVFDGKVFPEMI